MPLDKSMTTTARTPYIAYLCSLVLFPLLLTIGSTATAQEAVEEAEPTEEQLQLNDEAVKAIIEGDYSRAVALLEEARSIGELNIIYLNLGRAYQKLEKCEQARSALERVGEAPAVATPAPERISEKAQSYLEEVDEQCETDSQMAESGSGPASPEADSDAVAPPAEPRAQLWEWAVLGGGTLVALGGVGVHFIAEGKRDRVIGDGSYDGEINTEVTQAEAASLEDEANTLDSVALGMAITGGLVAATGTYLVLTGSEEPETSVSIQTHRQGASIVWSGRF